MSELDLEKIIVLDFDGVMIDSMDECLLSSYNAFHDLETVKETNEIPLKIREFFYSFRHFVRPAHEYYLIHKAIQEDIEFIDFSIYKHLLKTYSLEMEAFETRFFRTRNLFQENDMLGWLNLHKQYDQFINFLNKYKNKFYVLTNKDRQSVEILAKHFGFYNQIEAILSKEISLKKKELMNHLFVLLGRDSPKKIIFVDDSEWHLSDLQDFPLELFFATWGYSSKQNHHSFTSIKNLEEII